MAGNITSVNFSGRFKKLNGTVALTATRADIIRSLLTVGYPSRRAAVRVVGRWRERMLVAMATGYLDNALNTTLYFRNLEQSEKVGVSFLLGEAFTHWYAQDRMKIEYLVHVGGLSSCTWTSPTTPLTPKTGASLPAAKSRPDFIGIRRTESHVFESKGRIRRPAASAVVQGGIGDDADNCGRSETSRRAHRHHRRPPQLGLGDDPSSARPHDRAGRRHRAGREPMDIVAAGLPSPSQSTGQAVPPSVPDPAGRAPRRQSARLLRIGDAPGRPSGLPTSSEACSQQTHIGVRCCRPVR
jgi:hypothetical protein